MDPLADWPDTMREWTVGPLAVWPDEESEGGLRASVARQSMMDRRFPYDPTTGKCYVVNESADMAKPRHFSYTTFCNVWCW